MYKIIDCTENKEYNIIIKAIIKDIEFLLPDNLEVNIIDNDIKTSIYSKNTIYKDKIIFSKYILYFNIWQLGNLFITKEYLKRGFNFTNNIIDFFKIVLLHELSHYHLKHLVKHPDSQYINDVRELEADFLAINLFKNKYYLLDKVEV